MDILNLIVLTLTLGAVVWYTVITRRMQQAVVDQVTELVRQRRLSNMPAFIAGIRHRDGGDYLEPTNIGKGVAINVVIDPVQICFPILEPGRIEFDRVLMLRAGETAFIE